MTFAQRDVSSLLYVLEIEQRLFKPLADNNQTLYFVY